MKLLARQFIACRDMDHLAHLMGIRVNQLLEVGTAPVYEEFYIPKKKGGKRLIENPVPKLKRVQRRLNKYLQAVYYQHRTNAAYGFIANPVDDPYPRHILSNAQRHIGCEWLLNIDMRDFFHQILQERIEQLFNAPILNFPSDLARFLAELCAYKGRLPMGAPTSPVLTNLVCIPLDQDLTHWSESNELIYTRYADDMSFSSLEQLTTDQVAEIASWVQRYDLTINPQKIKFYGPSHPQKMVTGIIVGKEEVNVPDDYLLQLRGAIQKLGDIVDAQHLTPSGRDQPSPWVEELEDQIRGKLEFVRQIRGSLDPNYLLISKELRQAVEAPEEYGPVSWLDFGYQAPR